MNEDRYSFLSSRSYTDFIFDSLGPNGCIRKIVRYSPYNYGDYTYYNLAFGDLNEETGEIDDLSISDKSQKDKTKRTISFAFLLLLYWFSFAPLLLRPIEKQKQSKLKARLKHKEYTDLTNSISNNLRYFLPLPRFMLTDKCSFLACCRPEYLRCTIRCAQ